MAEIINKTMNIVSFDANPDIDIYRLTDKESRKVAKELLKNMSV